MEINKNVQELDIMEDQEVYELSSRENGARIVFATDDYFGVAENLLKEEEPVQQEGFTNFGKRIMDGWVTKSRHGKSHDFAIIEFAADVKIDFICIDTAFFTNNFPIQFSIQSARRAIPVHIQNRTDRLGQSATMTEMKRIDQIHSEAWPELLTVTNLEPGYSSVSKKFFVRCNTNWPSVTHLRLNIFPNGGVARLRVYGKTVHGLYQQPDSVRFDLISRIYNGRCVSYSSKHSGHPNNLLKPGSPINSDDGWETVKNMPNMKNIPLMAQQSEQSVVGEARDDVEWAIFMLGHIGQVHYVIIDTTYVKGNAPSFVHVEGLSFPAMTWLTLIPETKIIEGTEQIILTLENTDMFMTEVKLTIKPSASINRFRAFGTCLFHETGQSCAN
ncbi:probable inactive allantoicase isoform X1 [Temnothorax nylanderi]|uniref:probable inactive allantoicase isoform X1 n=1 Tax=Temnothorax nylanderi TaxID=102681 RepID=UPI003A8C69DC